MLRFFRIIRRKLIEEDKIRTYFWYALGEIFLVMVGILLALQINNWNQERQMHEIEFSYLQSLKVDLNADLEELDRLRSDKTSKVNSALDMMNMLPPENNAELMKFEVQLYIIFSWNTFKPNNNTFIELVSSGNLSIISNDAIKTSILELDKINKEIISTREHMRREYESYLYDPAVTQTNHLLFLNFDEFRNGKLFPLDTTIVYSGAELIQYNRQTKNMLSNQTFQNGLKLAVMNNSYILNMYEQMEDRIVMILDIIEADLEKG